MILPPGWLKLAIRPDLTGSLRIDVVGESLAVQAPALAVSHARQSGAKASEVGLIGQLALDGDLEVVARNGLVIGDGREPVQRPRLGLGLAAWDG